MSSQQFADAARGAQRPGRAQALTLALALAFAAGLAAAGPAMAQDDAAEEPDAAAPFDPSDPFSSFLEEEPEEDDDFRDTLPGESVVLRGLNKVTAATEDYAVEFDEPLQFGSLTVIVRTCSKRPPEFIPETFVFMEIYDRAFDGTGADEYGQKIFSGWMLGSSPALHGLEHPVYDIWPVDCVVPEDPFAVPQAAEGEETGETGAESEAETETVD